MYEAQRLSEGIDRIHNTSKIVPSLAIHDTAGMKCVHREDFPVVKMLVSP